MPQTDMDTERDRLVWDNLGIQYASIPDQEYKRMYPQFRLAEDAEFPNGGVIVRRVRPGSPAAQALLDAGDIIVGIDPDVPGLGPWEIASLNNMRFVGAQEWGKLQSQTDSILVDVIRNNTHYSAKISTR